MITILLAEDHAVVRQGLRKVLEAETDLSVVGEADNGLVVSELAESLTPDVVLLDLGLPGLHGLEVTRQIARRAPNSRVLVLSMYTHDEYVLGALQNGAAGYLAKGADSAEVVTAIREVAAGGRHVGTGIASRIGKAIETGAAPVPDPYDRLTTREREIFHAMAEGHSNAGIAAPLAISVRTVESHRANVLRKLGLRTQTEVVRYAIRRGVLPPE